MRDISKYLNVQKMELCSHISTYNESVLQEGNIYMIPKIRHDWEIRIDFERILFDNSEHICNLNIDNINLSIYDWKSIQHIEFDLDSLEDSEATFYLYEHHTINYFKCTITHIKDNVFEISLEFDITIRNFFEEPVKASWRIVSQVNYSGLEVQLFNLEPKPNTVSQIKDFVKESVNLDSYKEPQIKSQYLCVFEPKI